MCDRSKKCALSSLCDKKSKEETIVKLLHGTKLLKKNSGVGATPILDTDRHLAGKVVGFYFSAHWCPPCRKFTSVLKKFYEDAGDSEFEVIFFSKDHSKAECDGYFEQEQGNWCAVPYEDPLIEKLQNRYDVKSIPTLVIVKPNGEAVMKNAWASIQNASKSPKVMVAGWKEQCEG